MNTTRILSFIGLYGKSTKTTNDEDTELIMDNHICIKFDDETYYIPKDITYSERKAEVYEYLKEFHWVGLEDLNKIAIENAFIDEVSNAISLNDYEALSEFLNILMQKTENIKHITDFLNEDVVKEIENGTYNQKFY